MLLNYITNQQSSFNMIQDLYPQNFDLFVFQNQTKLQLMFNILFTINIIIVVFLLLNKDHIAHNIIFNSIIFMGFGLFAGIMYNWLIINNELESIFGTLVVFGLIYLILLCIFLLKNKHDIISNKIDFNHKSISSCIMIIIIVIELIILIKEINKYTKQYKYSLTKLISVFILLVMLGITLYITNMIEYLSEFIFNHSIFQQYFKNIIEFILKTYVYFADQIFNLVKLLLLTAILLLLVVTINNNMKSKWEHRKSNKTLQSLFICLEIKFLIIMPIIICLILFLLLYSLNPIKIIGDYDLNNMNWFKKIMYSMLNKLIYLKCMLSQRFTNELWPIVKDFTKNHIILAVIIGLKFIGLIVLITYMTIIWRSMKQDVNIDKNSIIPFVFNVTNDQDLNIKSNDDNNKNDNKTLLII